MTLKDPLYIFCQKNNLRRHIQTLFVISHLVCLLRFLIYLDNKVVQVKIDDRPHVSIVNANEEIHHLSDLN
jgi:hypothetical protein